MKYICHRPGPKSEKIIIRDSKVISPSLHRDHSFVFQKAKGCYLWDADGKKYLDFAAGIAVASIGHTNPEVVQAIKKQLNFGLHAGFPDFYAELPVKFVEFLLTFAPKYLNKAFLSNSGTESIEAAYKLAKWHTNRKWVIAFEGCFHGRTMGSLSMTKSKPVQRERFGPFLPVRHAPYPYYYRRPENLNKLSEKEYADYCLNEVEKIIKSLKGDVAGVFVEPIQGEGGYIVPPENFHQGLRKICTEHDVLLCDDEVQAGYWRTGTFLAIEGFGAKPDIVSLSKAAGAGMPIGTTLANEKTMDWPTGAHSNTFGGNLVACAAGIASLNYMRKHRLGENAKKIGAHMLKILEEIKDKYEILGDVRGRGLMIGIEIVKDKKSKKLAVPERDAVICEASKRGLVLLSVGDSAIRICPPLILTKEQAEKGLWILEEAIKTVNK